MSHRKRISVELALAMTILVPVAVAQKPPPPAPPPSQPPSRSATPPPSSSQPDPPTGDLVMFLRGRVATDDGTPVPHDVIVERVCNARISQQVYATSGGDFSMQLGSRSDSVIDASGDQSSEGLTGKDPAMGIPRHDLTKCELRASVSGFHSNDLSLVDLDNFGGNVDVGVIVVRRGAKVEGLTLSATPYKAPPDARKAYEKGLEAERKGKLFDASKYFETAVKIYPKYTSAWFQLGTVLRKENQRVAARSAFTEATKSDIKFLPPYLSLASMAYEAENWTEVLSFTGHVLDLDPFNHGTVTGYILDLDPLSCSEAYFYNAFANYRLNRIDDAEASGLKAEHVDLLTHFPELHLLMAEIYSRKNKYAYAISEIHTFLELAPYAKNADQVREHLAILEKLNGSVSPGEKPDQK
jgi:tetratricopeptide (TPR) repeat protein